MNCFLNEVRGYADLEEGGRNTDFALWQVRIQNIQNTEYELRGYGWRMSANGMLHSYLYFFWHNQLFAYHDNIPPTCWQVSWHADAAIEYASLRLRVRTLFPVCLWSTRCWVWDANCTVEQKTHQNVLLYQIRTTGALSKCGENLKSEWKEQKR